MNDDFAWDDGNYMHFSDVDRYVVIRGGLYVFAALGNQKYTAAFNIYFIICAKINYHTREFFLLFGVILKENTYSSPNRH